MKTTSALLLATALLATSPAWSQVTIDQPWVRATVGPQKATGAFLTLTAAKSTTLVAVSSPSAGAVEVHEMKMVDDVMRMRQVQALPLPAGKAVALVPGGYHLMLLNLKRQLKDGDKVALTFEFEDAAKTRSKVTVDALVKPIGTSATPH